MEVFALFLVLYLVAAPDRVSLALTRGVTGAARGAATGKTPKSRKPSPRRRAALAGWREGVKAARERREAGRDVWTRGTRLGGRVAGGTANLVHGIRDTILTRLARQASAGADASSGLDGADASPSSRGWSGPRPVRRPRTAPTSDAASAVVDENGNEVTPAADEPAESEPPRSEQPKPETVSDVPQSTPEAPKADPSSTTPEVAPQPDELDQPHTNVGAYFKQREAAEKHRQKVEALEAAAAAGSTPQTPEPALKPAPEPAPTGATNPNPHSNTTTALNGAKPMSLGTTELSNIDDYEKELKAVEASFELVAEAMASIRTWAVNLPDRWAAANWGTAGLDRSVASIAETVGALRMPAVAETFSTAKSEVTKARGLGEAAASVQARGKTEAFRGN